MPSNPSAQKSAKKPLGTGEAVPLIITLYSPGPFSGTAAFDLPDLSQTVFVKTGNPMVGSEEIDDESYMTQRHEFTLYTQRSGEIVVPAFRVRFSGKKTFTSDPEPVQGTTSELRFTSKRPPGTESMGVVISATAMKIQQIWNPMPEGKIKAGDVVVRTITRNAEGTTAMMLPPISTNAPEGCESLFRYTWMCRTRWNAATPAPIALTPSNISSSDPAALPCQNSRLYGGIPNRTRSQSESVAGLEINVAAGERGDAADG